MERALDFGNQVGFLDVREFDFGGFLIHFLAFALLFRCAEVKGDGAIAHLCEPALPMAVARHRLKGLELDQAAGKASEVLTPCSLRSSPGEETSSVYLSPGTSSSTSITVPKSRLKAGNRHA